MERRRRPRFARLTDATRGCRSLTAELGEAAGGDTEAVGRTAGEITEELAKVSRARNNATRKLIRCRDRLLELDEEERRCAG